MRTRRAPCDECPWRRDVAKGAFPVIPAALGEQAADSTATLRSTRRSWRATRRRSARICRARDGSRSRATTTWAFRLAVIDGRIDAARLSAGAGWPPLVADLAEMVARHPASDLARHAAEATPRG